MALRARLKCKTRSLVRQALAVLCLGSPIRRRLRLRSATTESAWCFTLAGTRGRHVSPRYGGVSRGLRGRVVGAPCRVCLTTSALPGFQPLKSCGKFFCILQASAKAKQALRPRTQTETKRASQCSSYRGTYSFGARGAANRQRLRQARNRAESTAGKLA